MRVSFICVLNGNGVDDEDDDEMMNDVVHKM